MLKNTIKIIFIIFFTLFTVNNLYANNSNNEYYYKYEGKIYGPYEYIKMHNNGIEYYDKNGNGYINYNGKILGPFGKRTYNSLAGWSSDLKVFKNKKHLIFSYKIKDSKYKIKDGIGQSVFLNIDGKDYGPYSGIFYYFDSLENGDSDDNIGFVYSIEDDDYIFFNGQIYGPFKDIYRFYISREDGFLALSHKYVIVNGKKYGPYYEILGYPYMLENGNFLIKYKRDRNSSEYYAIINSKEYGPYKYESEISGQYIVNNNKLLELVKLKENDITKGYLDLKSNKKYSLDEVITLEQYKKNNNLFNVRIEKCQNNICNFFYVKEKDNLCGKKIFINIDGRNYGEFEGELKGFYKQNGKYYFSLHISKYEGGCDFDSFMGFDKSKKVIEKDIIVNEKGRVIFDNTKLVNIQDEPNITYSGIFQESKVVLHKSNGFYFYKNNSLIGPYKKIRIIGNYMIYNDFNNNLIIKNIFDDAIIFKQNNYDFYTQLDGENIVIFYKTGDKIIYEKIYLPFKNYNIKNNSNLNLIDNKVQKKLNLIYKKYGKDKLKSRLLKVYNKNPIKFRNIYQNILKDISKLEKEGIEKNYNLLFKKKLIKKILEDLIGENIKLKTNI